MNLIPWETSTFKPSAKKIWLVFDVKWKPISDCYMKVIVIYNDNGFSRRYYRKIGKKTKTQYKIKLYTSVFLLPKPQSIIQIHFNIYNNIYIYLYLKYRILLNIWFKTWKSISWKGVTKHCNPDKLTEFWCRTYKTLTFKLQAEPWNKRKRKFTSKYIRISSTWVTTTWLAVESSVQWCSGRIGNGFKLTTPIV